VHPALCTRGQRLTEGAAEQRLVVDAIILPTQVGALSVQLIPDLLELLEEASPRPVDLQYAKVLSTCLALESAERAELVRELETQMGERAANHVLTLSDRGF